MLTSLRLLLPVALAVSLVAAVPGVAQKPAEDFVYEVTGPDGGKQIKVFASSYARNGVQGEYVKLEFQVHRRDNGALATDVTKDEIVVREDGRPVTILELSQPQQHQLTTVLALDVSGSMVGPSGSGTGKTKMEEARTASQLFLDKLDPHAEAGLLLFDHEVVRDGDPLAASRLRHPMRDRAELKRLIDAAQPRGGTAYLDAAASAARMLKGVSGRKAVVLMTDGVDMNSKLTLEQAIHEAKILEVPVYTIGIGEPGKLREVTSVLVLDHSGSMKDPASDTDRIPKIQALHRAASRFIQLMRPQAQTMLMPFSTQVEPPTQFSRDKKSLIEKVQALQPEGGTLLYDATMTGIETLLADPNQAHAKGKRAVVVLTDGRDEAPGSRVSDQDVIDRAKEAGIALYMLGLGRPEEINVPVMKRMAKETGGLYDYAADQKQLFEVFEKLSIALHDDGIDEDSLKRLAAETGGRYYPAKQVKDLELAFSSLATELQSTFTVLYKSDRANDGTARQPDVQVWRNGQALSGLSAGAYNVRGVVVPEMDYRIYLVLLLMVVGLLAFPSGMRRLHRFYGGA